MMSASYALNDEELARSADLGVIGFEEMRMNGSVGADRYFEYYFDVDQDLYAEFFLKGLIDDLDLKLWGFDRSESSWNLLASSEKFGLEDEYLLFRLPPGDYSLEVVLDGNLRQSGEGSAFELLIDAKNFNQLSVVPDDPRFERQWYLLNTGQASGLPGNDISAPFAWKLGSEGSDVVVAIIDSGVDIDHEDLKGNIWTNHGEIAGNGIDDDRNGYVDDLHGWNFRENSPAIVAGNHGTHIAGIVGAEWGNGVGIAGVARSVRLMTLEVSSSDDGWTRPRVVEAIRYAVNNGADIINLSFGGPFYGTFEEYKVERENAYLDFQAAFQYAQDRGVLTVVAAGNKGEDFERFTAAPAVFSREFDSVISVAAVGNTGHIPAYSNFGEEVTVAAPGGDRTTSGTDQSNILSTLPNNTYGYRNGTSMAAPVVAGIAALVKGQNSNLTNFEVADILKRTSVAHDSLQGFVAGGRVVNANKAVLEAQRLSSQVVDVLIGDSNNSGSHDVGDAISILRQVVGLESSLSEFPGVDPITIMDVNADGSIGVSDAIAVLRSVVGLDEISGVAQVPIAREQITPAALVASQDDLLLNPQGADLLSVSQMGLVDLGANKSSDISIL